MVVQSGEEKMYALRLLVQPLTRGPWSGRYVLPTEHGPDHEIVKFVPEVVISASSPTEIANWTKERRRKPSSFFVRASGARRVVSAGRRVGAGQVRVGAAAPAPAALPLQAQSRRIGGLGSVRVGPLSRI